MENCMYQGKEICSYELKDECGIYHQERVLELKRAASKGELTCSECRQRVYLAAGLIKEPYFAHYDIESCSYGDSGESEEMKIGKRLLYHILKSSFPEYEIKARYRLENGTYTSFYVFNPNGQDLAIDYRLTQLPIKLLDERREYYETHHITPVFILGVRQDKDSEQLNWYQTCVQEILGYCIFFDVWKEEMLLKRSFHGKVERYAASQVFDEVIPVSKLVLLENGCFDCDFVTRCVAKEKDILSKLKEKADYERKQKEQEELYYQKQKELEQKLEQERQEKNEAVNQKFEEYYRWAVDEQQASMNELLEIVNRVDFSLVPLTDGIRRDILLNCVDYIKSGDAELVSEKYCNYIRKFG